MLPIMKLTQKTNIKKHNNLTKKVKKTRQIIRYYNKNNTKINKNMTGGILKYLKTAITIDESESITDAKSFIDAILRCKVAGILLFIFKQSDNSDSNFQKNSAPVAGQSNTDDKFKVDKGKKGVFSFLTGSIFGKKRYYKKVKSIVKKVTDIRLQIKNNKTIADNYKLKSIIEVKKKKYKLKLCLMYLFFYYKYNTDVAFTDGTHNLNAFCNKISNKMETREKIDNKDYYQIVTDELTFINNNTNNLLETLIKKRGSDRKEAPQNKIPNDEISMCIFIHNNVIFNNLNVDRAYTTIDYGSEALDAVVNKMNDEIVNDLVFIKQQKFNNTKIINDLLNVDSNVIGSLLIDYFEISAINSIVNLIESIKIKLNNNTSTAPDADIIKDLTEISTKLLTYITPPNVLQLKDINKTNIELTNIKQTTEDYKLYYNSINKTNSNTIAKDRFKPIIDNIFEKIEKFTQIILLNDLYKIDAAKNDDPKIIEVKTYIKNFFDNIKNYIDADRLNTDGTYTKDFLFNIFVKKYINDDYSDLEEPVTQPTQKFTNAQTLVTINKSSELYKKLAKLNKSITEFKNDLNRYMEILNTVCKNVNFTLFTNNTENDKLFDNTTTTTVYRQKHDQLNPYLPFLIMFSRMCFDNEKTPKTVNTINPQTLEHAQFLIHKLLTRDDQATKESFKKAYPDIGVSVDTEVTTGLNGVLPGKVYTIHERFLWDKDKIFNDKIYMPIPPIKHTKILQDNTTNISIECNKILQEQIQSIFVLFNDLYINKVLKDILASETILTTAATTFHA